MQWITADIVFSPIYVSLGAQNITGFLSHSQKESSGAKGSITPLFNSETSLKFLEKSAYSMIIWNHMVDYHDNCLFDLVSGNDWVCICNHYYSSVLTKWAISELRSFWFCIWLDSKLNFIMFLFLLNSSLEKGGLHSARISPIGNQIYLATDICHYFITTFWPVWFVLKRSI